MTNMPSSPFIPEDGECKGVGVTQIFVEDHYRIYMDGYANGDWRSLARSHGEYPCMRCTAHDRCRTRIIVTLQGDTSNKKVEFTTREPNENESTIAVLEYE